MRIRYIICKINKKSVSKTIVLQLKNWIKRTIIWWQETQTFISPRIAEAQKQTNEGEILLNNSFNQTSSPSMLILLQWLPLSRW